MKWFVLLALVACKRASTPVPPNTPVHGVVLTISGLGATGPVETWFRFDADARVLLSYQGPYDGANETEHATRHALSADEAAALWARAKVVLHRGTPETEHVTDYMQRIVIDDGGDAIDATGDGPFDDSAAKALQDELSRLAAGTARP